MAWRSMIGEPDLDQVHPGRRGGGEVHRDPGVGGRPAKANLLTRWQRQADRLADYVPLPNPWGAPPLPAAAAR
jgi:hypothetical protein